MVLALTAEGRVRESDLDGIMNFLRRPCESRDDSRRDYGRIQIFPVTSFCIRLAISISRRQACSRNDITLSMSRSLGSGISILRSLSVTFGSDFFNESAFGSGSSILPLTVGS